MRWILVAALIVVVSFVAGFSTVAALRKPRVPAAPAAASTAPAGMLDPRFVYKVELDDAPTRGPEDALVTVVVFGDYDAANGAVEARLRDVGNVRLVWKALPARGAESSAHASLLARAGRAAAAQGRFWELHDRLMAAPPADQAALERAATAAGLDLARFRADLVAPATSRAVAADMAQAQRFGLETAPAVFVNGHIVPNPSLAQLREQIDDARAFAMQLTADGTPPAKVYKSMMRGALPNAGPISATNFE
jgi:protein-disulfide isomerase